MIHLLNEACTNIGSFTDYDHLVDHINKTESSRTKLLNALNHTLEIPHILDQTRWSFIRYEYGFLRTVYSCMKEPPLTGIEREAFRQGLDLIEIYQGSEDNPLQIPVGHDTDIGSLKKDFCLAYCEAHKYTLSETFGTSKTTEDSETSGSRNADAEGRWETTGGEDDPVV